MDLCFLPVVFSRSPLPIFRPNRGKYTFMSIIKHPLSTSHYTWQVSFIATLTLPTSWRLQRSAWIIHILSLPSIRFSDSSDHLSPSPHLWTTASNITTKATKITTSLKTVTPNSHHLVSLAWFKLLASMKLLSDVICLLVLVLPWVYPSIWTSEANGWEQSCRVTAAAR